jgi:hypothetical protein
MVSVTCPDGSNAGDTIHMQLPGTAQMFAITVPTGVEEGQCFNVNIPANSTIVASDIIPSTAAQPVSNPLSNSHYHEFRDDDMVGMAGNGATLVDMLPPTEEEVRLFPVYQLGRVIKSVALIDVFMVLLWGVWRERLLLVLAPFAFTGYFAGHRYNRLA